MSLFVSLHICFNFSCFFFHFSLYDFLFGSSLPVSLFSVIPLSFLFLSYTSFRLFVSCIYSSLPVFPLCDSAQRGVQQELRTTPHRLPTKPPEHKFKGSDIRTRLTKTEFGSLQPPKCMRLLDVTCGLRGQLTSLFDLHA